MNRPRRRRLLPRLWPIALVCLLLAIAAALRFAARASAQATTPAEEDPLDATDTAADDAAAATAAAAAAAASSSSGDPVRLLLFRPLAPELHASADPTAPAPFPSSAARALDSPYPLHMVVDALAPAIRLRFQTQPSVPVSASIVGFDWARNTTTGVVRDAAGTVQWQQGLPEWVQFIAASSSVAVPDGAAAGGAGGSQLQSSPNTFTLSLTAPQSGERSTIYTSPPPILMQFSGVVQYLCAPPIRPEDAATGPGAAANDASDSQPQSTSDLSDPSAPSSASGGGGAAVPLVLIVEVQTFSLLLSLTVLPPVAQRTTDLSPFYALAPTPNLLDPRNRLTNRGGGGSAQARAQGLGSKRLDWRDEIVMDCSAAQGHECSLCTAESGSSGSIGPLGSVHPYPALQCSTPAGAFFNIARGTLKVAAPVAFGSALQINAGATLEFDHALPSAAAAGSASVVAGVSVIDCRDVRGAPIAVINEGTIVVKRGHLVLYSAMHGRGAIHVHAGGSVEFVSLQPHSSSSASVGGSAASSVPNIVRFNHTIVQPEAAVSTPAAGMARSAFTTAAAAAGMSVDAMLGGGPRSPPRTRSSFSMRSLLQIEDSGFPVSSSTGAVDDSGFPVSSSTGAREPLVVDTFETTAASNSSQVGMLVNETTTSSSQGFPVSSTGAIEPIVVDTFETTAASNSSQTSSNETTTAEAPTTTPTPMPPLPLPETVTNSSSSPSSNSSNSSNSTDPLPAPAPTPAEPPVIVPSVPSPAPPAPSSPARAFSPHPTSILVSYGGGVLFSHGRFAFLAPFQSSLFAAGTTSTQQPGGARNNALNRMLVAKAAAVSFEEVPAALPSAAAPVVAGSLGNSSSHSNATTPPQPLGHLLSFTHFLNRGLVYTGANSLVNLTGGLFFQSAGLMHLGPGSRTTLELSDDAARNLCDGIDARRGSSIEDGGGEDKTTIDAVVAMIARADTEPDPLPTPSNSSNETAATVDPLSDLISPLSSESDGGGSSASISSSLASLQSSLSSPSSGGLVSRASGGGVGLLVDGAFLLVRGGRLHFRGGLVARGDSHLFLKKGAVWVFDVEPTVSAQWGTSREDGGASMLYAAAAGSAPSASVAPSAAPSDSVSFLHIAGIEFSCDGLLRVRSGHMRLETPLLLIEGHGQIVFDSRRASMEMDNSRVNRAIALAQVLGSPSDSSNEPESVLVENPLAAEDPDADLYSFQPANVTASSDDPAAAAPTAVVPSFRENLIAPCTITLACRSLLFTNGARLGVGALSFLHLLPRARALVSSTMLLGGSLYLDSGAEYAGRALVANVSQSSGNDDATAASGAGSSVAQGIYVGNSSRLLMREAVEPLLPPSLPWTPSSAAAADSASVVEEEVTQLSPSFCALLSGNVSGNGVVDCGASAISVDSVVLYPSFRSPSPFSPVVYTPPPAPVTTAAPSTAAAATTAVTAKSEVLPAPRLQFDSALVMTSRTQTVLDIFGYHSIASIRLSDTATLGGSLLLNASLHVWPFDTTLGSSSINAARNRGKSSLEKQLLRSFGGSTASGTVRSGISLDGGSGDDDSSASVSASATDNSAAASNSSSSDAPPPPPPGMDYSVLLSSGLGFLPLDSAPSAFESISLASLYSVLPPAYTLEIEWVHSAASARPRIVGTGAGNVSIPLAETVKNELWLSARGPDYIQPRRNESNNRKNAAGRRMDAGGGGAAATVLELALLGSLAAVFLFAS